MQRVSIITRTKDRTILLRRALESALCQSHSDWEMIIVNDGGNPGDVDALVHSVRDRAGDRIHVIHHPRSLGMEAASNAGIRIASGDYFVIHDDDDSWHPDFLRECLDYLSENSKVAQLGGVVTHSVRIQESIEGDQVTTSARDPFNPWLHTVTLYRMAAGNIFPPISFLYKRSALEAIGPYREDLPVLGDWEFNLRFLMHFEIGVIPKELAYYHHRMTVQAGAYSNSVIGGHNKHVFYDALLRNELLRKDLEERSLGLGFLVNFAKGVEDTTHGIHGLRDASWFLYTKDRVYNLLQAAKRRFAS